MWSKLYYITEIEKKKKNHKNDFRIGRLFACLFARSLARLFDEDVLRLGGILHTFQFDRVSFDSKTSRVSFTNGFSLTLAISHITRIEIHALINAIRTM